MRDLPIILPPGGIQNVSRFIPELPGEPMDTQIATSYLGTPIYSNLVFSGNGFFNSSLVFDTVLFDVNQEKNIVRTSVQGRKGTVKEYISLGDYMITINGLIVSPYANEAPKKEVNSLRELLELSESLEVSSDFLQLFSIHNIAVEGYTFSEVMGSRNQVAFTIRALSDDPIEVREI